MTSKHHIRRHALQVQYRRGGDGFAARKDAASWQQEVWLPMLEKVLDQYNVPGQVISIPRINLVIPAGNKAWGTELAEAALRQIEEVLSKQIGNPATPGQAYTATAIREVELLIYYLRRGHLPWWTEVKGGQQWEAWLRTFFERIDRTQALSLAAAFSDGRARIRLVKNLEEEVFWNLVQLLAGSDELVAIWRGDWDIIQHAGNHPGSIDVLSAFYKDAILLALSRQNGNITLNEQFSAALVRTIPGVQRISDIGSLKNSTLREALTVLPVLQPKVAPEPAAKEDRDNEDHPLYISGAGLVIVAPFLIDLFTNLQLLGKDKLITDPSKAVALVYYLATGETDAPETELVMPKVLCGVPLHQPISIKDVALSAGDCMEADALLQAVIEHWAALKNTSPDGLRVNFLQRDGRLLLTGSGWGLKVQQESYDLLLSFLPWSISYVKLPWMDTLLQVEWN